MPRTVIRLGRCGGWFVFSVRHSGGLSALFVVRDGPAVEVVRKLGLPPIRAGLRPVVGLDLDVVVIRDLDGVSLKHFGHRAPDFMGNEVSLGGRNRIATPLCEVRTGGTAVSVRRRWGHKGERDKTGGRLRGHLALEHRAQLVVEDGCSAASFGCEQWSLVAPTRPHQPPPVCPREIIKARC